MMRVDSHQHYWTIKRNDYGWLTPSTGILYADYLMQDLKPELDKHQIDKTIIVQAAPTVAETEYMISLGEVDDTVIGVVGWLNFESSTDEFLEVFLRLKKNPLFVGVRPMIQDLPSGWLLQDQVVANLKVLAEYDFPIDLQLQTWLLPTTIELLGIIPNLRAVIDHIAKPNIRGGVMDPWMDQIAHIATFPNTMCKLSGMLTEVSSVEAGAAQLKPYVDHILQVFGPTRVMFGSDWPVCLIASTYDEVMRTLETLLPKSWTTENLQDVYGRNALSFYKLLER